MACYACRNFVFALVAMSKLINAAGGLVLSEKRKVKARERGRVKDINHPSLILNVDASLGSVDTLTNEIERWTRSRNDVQLF